jgi:hypothetical protein
MAALKARAKEARDGALAPDKVDADVVPSNIKSIVTSSAAALARVGTKGKDPVVKKLEDIHKVEEKLLKAVEAGGLFVA